MGMAHKFSASQVAVVPKVFKSQEIIEPMIPGRDAAALPAKLVRARLRARMCFFTHFQITLVGWLGRWCRGGHTPPSTSQRKHKGRDCHPNCREDGCNSDTLFPKEGANALSECCVLMEDSSECLADSVNLGPLCLLRGLRFLTLFLFLCLRALAQDS